MDDNNKDNELSPELKNAVEMMKATAPKDVEAPAPAEPAPSAEPAPAAPAAPVAEAPQAAAPVVNNEPVITDGASVVEPAGAKKKSKKKPIIIGSIIALVVAAAGGLGIAYAINSNPENITLSAIASFIDQKEKNINGTFELVSNTDYNNNLKGGVTNCGGSGSLENKCISYQSPLQSAKLEIKATSDSDLQTEGSATLTIVYSGNTLTLSLGLVTLKDSTIYVSIDGLKAAIKNAYQAIESTDYGTLYDIYKELIDQIVGEIDGNWWKINIPELIDSYDTIDQADKIKLKNTYNCMSEAFKKSVSKSSEYVDLYKKNAFVSAKKYEGNKQVSGKGTPYAVSIDAEKLANFINAVAAKDDFSSCIEQYDSSYSAQSMSISSNTVKALVDQYLNSIIITIDSNLFSHELTGLFVEASAGEYNGNINFSFSKPSNKVSAPANSKDAKDLIQNISTTYTDWSKTAECKYIKVEYPEYFDYYCDANYHPIVNYTVQNNYNI